MLMELRHQLKRELTGLFIQITKARLMVVGKINTPKYSVEHKKLLGRV